MIHRLPIVIGILALLGAVDSAYMTLAHYSLVSSFTNSPSNVCPLTGEGCAAVFASPQAKVLGVPHAVAGLGYFLVLLASAIWRIRTGAWFAPVALLAFNALGVIWSLYLTQELLFRMHIPCPYCLAAHLINGVILIAYVLSLRADLRDRGAMPHGPLRTLLRPWTHRRSHN